MDESVGGSPHAHMHTPALTHVNSDLLVTTWFLPRPAVPTITCNSRASAAEASVPPERRLRPVVQQHVHKKGTCGRQEVDGQVPGLEARVTETTERPADGFRSVADNLRS